MQTLSGTAAHPLTSAARIHDSAFDLAKYWAILRYLVRARMLTSSQSRVLGAIWWLLEPLALCLIYVFFIKILLKRGGDQYPFFILSAMLPWRWFVSAASSSTGSLVRKAGVLKSVKSYPSLYPLAEVGYATVMFIWSLPVLGLLMAWYEVLPSVQLLWFPILMALQLLYIFSFSMLLAISHVFFRDTIEFWNLIARVWFYLSPCIYAVELVPSAYRAYYLMNPFAVLLPAYRSVVMDQTAPPLASLLWVALGGIAMLAISSAVFRTLSKRVPNYL